MKSGRDNHDLFMVLMPYVGLERLKLSELTFSTKGNGSTSN
jgi:hypothetical protein